jgi:NAD(P)-dependent dehydrogenase (short-subunit alcohol dehydrogenase family)
VAVADILVENADRVANAINAAGGKAVAIYCDVTDRASVKRMKDAATAALGPIQLVFANAGATSFDPLAEMSEDDIEWIIDVNLLGVARTTRAFLPDMIAAGGGHICATASMAGLLPGWIPTHAPCSAAKAGIIGLMMNLALELNEHGIHTTSYCPGGVATGMKENNARYRPAKFGGPGEGEVHVSDHSKSVAASQAFYTPEAIAPMVLDAVMHNRAFAFDHPEQRVHFRSTYSDVVEACYDATEAWEREHGVPDANPTGPVLLNPAG